MLNGSAMIGLSALQPECLHHFRTNAPLCMRCLVCHARQTHARITSARIHLDLAGDVEGSGLHAIGAREQSAFPGGTFHHDISSTAGGKLTTLGRPWNGRLYIYYRGGNLLLLPPPLYLSPHLTTMSLSNGLEKLGLNGSAGDKKAADLQKDTVDYHAKGNVLTTDFGVKQANTDDWLKVATEDHTGPQLLEDHMGREKIHRFDHERIPERVVHARGAGAFGTFKMHKSLEKYTCAKVLTDISRSTPLFQRFSTVLGSSGSADTVRDTRGFALKFYTEEGNWDIGKSQALS